MTEDNSLRLQKYVADCGVMSRRAAEAAITEGRITVNGSRAVIGQKIDPDHDEVRVDGKAVYPAHEDKICVMLYKPTGVVSTADDEKGRPVVTDLVNINGRRLYPVGRLDLNSEGLILLTDDGDLTLQLTHPRHEIPKIYHVTVKGPVSAEQLKLLRAPLVIDGYKIRPVKTEVLETPTFERNATVLCMTLFEGRNRQIRKMCDIAGVTVTKLCRVAIGNLTLGPLKPGRWRLLSKKETEYLMVTSKNSHQAY